MKTVIIYAHPYEKSFNHAVLENVIKQYEEKREGTVEVIDLYQDNFNPIYTAEELSLYSRGETLDPLVEKYQILMKEADELVFIFPIWWNDVPAIVKGFMDKVMKKQFAYIETQAGIKGLLTNIKKVVVFTTSTSPTWYFKIFGGNAIQKIFMKKTLKQIGIGRIKWMNCGNISNKTNEQRHKYLEQIKNKI